MMDNWCIEPFLIVCALACATFFAACGGGEESKADVVDTHNAVKTDPLSMIRRAVEEENTKLPAYLGDGMEETSVTMDGNQVIYDFKIYEMEALTFVSEWDDTVVRQMKIEQLENIRTSEYAMMTNFMRMCKRANVDVTLRYTGSLSHAVAEVVIYASEIPVF